MYVCTYMHTYRTMDVVALKIGDPAAQLTVVDSLSISLSD